MLLSYIRGDFVYFSVFTGSVQNAEGIVFSWPQLLAANEDSLFGVVSIGDNKVCQLAGLNRADLVHSARNNYLGFSTALYPR